MESKLLASSSNCEMCFVAATPVFTTSQFAITRVSGTLPSVSSKKKLRLLIVFLVFLCLRFLTSCFLLLHHTLQRRSLHFSHSLCATLLSQMQSHIANNWYYLYQLYSSWKYICQSSLLRSRYHASWLQALLT